MGQQRSKPASKPARKPEQRKVSGKAANNQRGVRGEALLWAKWQIPESQPGRHRSGSAHEDARFALAAEEKLNHAVDAVLRGDELALADAVDGLIAHVLTTGRRAGVVILETQLVRIVGDRYETGWQPLDLVHVVGKVLSSEHRRIISDVIALERNRSQRVHLHPHWRAQLDALGVVQSGADVNVEANENGNLFREPGGGDLVEEMELVSALCAAIELFVCCRRLPKLPVLIHPPSAVPVALAQSARADHLDEKLLAKVRGLLAKAESTTFNEEAEALTAKAQELMARHAIDIALLDAGAPAVGGVEARRLHIEEPYVEAKSVLLTVVAEANRCSAVMASQLGIVTVFGFPTDIEITELLFTSLLTQATSSMVAAGQSVDWAGTSRTKSFRRTFIVSFATRIGERLRVAGQAATDDAVAALGDSLLPVLSNRSEQVSARQAEVFPNLTTTRTSGSNAAGWHAGRAAADRASLNANPAGIGSRSVR